MVKILLLEDDLKLAGEIKKHFETKGLECDLSYDGHIFLKLKRQADYNIFILDINVPGINGMEVCKQIRKTDKNTPILMLTAFSSVLDKIEAYNLGADDYIVKPFCFDELDAHIRALLRRSMRGQSYNDKILSFGDLLINIDKMYVTRAGKEINLSPKEFKLLALLASGEGKAISKKSIAEQVWNDNLSTSLNTVEVYINFLRKKIDAGFKHKLIQTKTGYGYYIENS